MIASSLSISYYAIYDAFLVPKNLGSGGFLFCVTCLGMVLHVGGEANEAVELKRRGVGCTELELCYWMLFAVVVAML